MNALSTTRFSANVLLGLAGALLLVAALVGKAPLPGWVLTIGAIALFGGVAQFIASVLSPKSIRPAWDEQTVASHRGSYQFGYWMALLAFWLFFALTQLGNLDPQTAFLWLGPVLIITPSVWMIIATLTGRAG